MVAARDVVDGDPVGAYLAELMTTVVRATPGPLTTARRGGSYLVSSTAVRRPLGVFARPADAALFARAVVDLRSMAGVVAELLAGHHDDGRGRCTACGQRSLCWTRRIIDSELLPRASA